MNREIRHFHLFCGLGGGAAGFNRGEARVGSLQAKFRCLGGIDVDSAAIRDFTRLAGVPGTVLDLFDRNQYRAFHGAEPPPGWREATPSDIRRAAGNERPHIVFTSAPCKGFSGLLSEGRSKTDKYQALNRLTLRGIWLTLEAWANDPPELVIFENVPRIANRGRHLLDQIGALLRQYGYAVAETTHDCGELGALAQSRKRFLLVARHIEKVPPFLYEPEKKRLQAVGTVLGRMPLPGDAAGGPMHRIPLLQWKTWVRLAFVEAGSDWRSLTKLAVEDGHLRDYLLVPEMHNGTMGVVPWDASMGVVTGNARPHTGNFSVADPRPPAGSLEYQQYGVVDWNDTMGAVINVKSPGQGTFAVADPRHAGPAKHSNEFRIVPWDRAACAVTGAHGTDQCCADPRPPAGPLFSKYAVSRWDQNAGTVIGGDDSGAYAVADPRSGLDRGRGDSYLTGGHYGVVSWASPSGAVSAAACHDNGRWSVADPRLPEASDKLVAVIRSLDGTWHRPFTTLELAALQSLVDPEETLELDGLSDGAWRERIGNAVPPAAAEAIAGVMGTTLLLAWSGETFVLGRTPIWVRPVAVALSVSQAEA
ncbi:c-5 cytosine-specific DNA methylase [Burkholderiales bacterium GJ-E10]|nr:c-5 cytosine-specific DNA methylase [Burkholderiales bacterium GJ-E10]